MALRKLARLRKPRLRALIAAADVQQLAMLVPADLVHRLTEVAGYMEFVEGDLGSTGSAL